MPHLSPMSWIMAMISFWISLIFFSSIQWWNITPTYQNLKQSYSPFKFQQWNW